MIEGKSLSEFFRGRKVEIGKFFALAGGEMHESNFKRVASLSKIFEYLGSSDFVMNVGDETNEALGRSAKIRDGEGGRRASDLKRLRFEEGAIQSFDNGLRRGLLSGRE